MPSGGFTATWLDFAVCGRLSVGKGFLCSSARLGRCGRVFDLLVRHRRAAGHNAFREDGSRPKARARSASAILGFPIFRFDRLSHYFMSALPNFVGLDANAYLISTRRVARDSAHRWS